MEMSEMPPNQLTPMPLAQMDEAALESLLRRESLEASIMVQRQIREWASRPDDPIPRLWPILVGSVLSGIAIMIIGVLIAKYLL